MMMINIAGSWRGMFVERSLCALSELESFVGFGHAASGILGVFWCYYSC
jgi:hypothetical protein